MNHQHTIDASHVLTLAGSTGFGALLGDRVLAGVVAFFFSILAMIVAEVARPWIQRWARRYAPPPEPAVAPELAARPTVEPPAPPSH